MDDGPDGSFGTQASCKIEEAVARCQVAAQLHEKISKCQMLHHELVNGNPMIQKTTFSDGTTVKVDFEHQTYKICSREGQ